MIVSKVDTAVQHLQPIIASTDRFPLPKLPLDLIEKIILLVGSNARDLSNATRTCKRTYLVLGRLLARQETLTYMNLFYSVVISNGGLGVRVLAPRVNQMANIAMHLTFRAAPVVAFHPLQAALTQLPKVETLTLHCTYNDTFSVAQLGAIFAAPDTTVKKLIITGHVTASMIHTILAASQTIEELDLSESDYEGTVQSARLLHLSINSQGLKSTLPYDAIFLGCPQLSKITIYDDLFVGFETKERLRLGCLYRYSSEPTDWGTLQKWPTIDVQLSDLRRLKKQQRLGIIGGALDNSKSINKDFEISHKKVYKKLDIILISEKLLKPQNDSYFDTIQANPNLADDREGTFFEKNSIQLLIDENYQLESLREKILSWQENPK